MLMLTHLAGCLLVADPEEADEPGPVGEQRGQQAGQRGEDEAGRPPGDAHLQQHEAEAKPEADREVNNPGVMILIYERRALMSPVKDEVSPPGPGEDIALGRGPDSQ